MESPALCSEHAVPAIRSSVLSGNQAGFHRFKVGATTITSLCDGHFPLVARDVLHGDPSSLDRMLGDAREGAVIASHVHAFLIDDGEHRILIDAGAGDLQDATLGRVAGQLATAGVAFADIDAVFVTHLHPDHIGGLTRRGHAVFPRATVHVPRKEADFWLGTGAREDVDDSVRATFDHAREVLEPYIAAGRCRFFDAGAAGYDHLVAESLPGHTAGHTGYRLRTGAQDVVFCGDLFHVAAVQLAEPGVTVCYDSQPGLAHATRAVFLAEACRQGDIVAAAHAPFPGLGRIQQEGSGFAWQSLS